MPTLSCFYCIVTSSNGDCWDVHRDHVLYGYNDRVISYVTMEECRAMCVQETGFLCLSLDYVGRDRKCYLSSGSAQTHPGMLGSHGVGSTMREVENVVPQECQVPLATNRLQIQVCAC